MVIFTKTIDDIKNTIDILHNSCDQVESGLYADFENRKKYDNELFDDYDSFVNWALYAVINHLPSPFSIEYPHCYGLSIGANYFSIKTPDNVGFGINVVRTKKAIIYEISIVFYTDERFIKDSEDYKSMIKNGWTIKDRKFNK